MKGYGIRIAPYAEFLLYRQIVNLNQKQKNYNKKPHSVQKLLKIYKN